MRKTRVFVGVLLLIVVVGAGFGLALARKSAQYRVQLAEGGSLTIKQITLTATNHSYSYNSRGPIWDRVVPILPDFISRKIPMSGGSFGFGADGNTNLFIITELRHSQNSGQAGIGRLRVSDGTNVYDACWGAHTLGYPGVTVNGWQVRAFPRRAKDLTLEFFSMQSPSGNWTVAAAFRIPNPAAGEFPQWEPGPTQQTNKDLTVRLEKFESGERMHSTWGKGDSQIVARKTRMFFAFEEEGKPTEDWRVQKVMLQDATGNRWFPYLDLVKPGFSWAQGGQVEFFGALWSGEAAWKLDVETVRTRGLAPADLFTLEVPLPAPAEITTLTNRWEHDGVAIKFVGLASPNTDHSGDFKWIGKWWGEDKDKICSLVLELSPDLNGQRLQFFSAVDDHGDDVELISHQNQDYPKQAFFFKPATDVEKLKLTFSLTHSRFVQFLARPEFVRDGAKL